MLIKRPWYKFWGNSDPSGELAFHQQSERCLKLLEDCKDNGYVDKDDWRDNNIPWKTELQKLFQTSTKVIKYKIDLVKKEDKKLHGG